MTHQPDDLGEAYAEQSQEDLGVRDENWLTDNTDELNQRHADGTPGPLSEQPAGADTDISTEPEPPAGA